MTTTAASAAETFARVAAAGVVPVITIDDERQADGLREALLAAGLPIAEVTFRTPAAPGALERLARGGELLVGAGTVLEPRQVQTALAAGAAFVVSPGLDRDLVRHAASLGLPALPGVATATEIQAALADGLRLLKLFPAASVGGPAAVAALAAPFGDVRFVPTGGIGPDDAADYLRLPAVAAVGGSWIAPASLLRAGDFDAVRERAAHAVQLVARVRAQVQDEVVRA